MKMIQFIVGTIVGGMIGVAMMCLMQINRLYRHDRRWKNDTDGNDQNRKRRCGKQIEKVSADFNRKGGWTA